MNHRWNSGQVDHKLRESVCNGGHGDQKVRAAPTGGQSDPKVEVTARTEG